MARGWFEVLRDQVRGIAGALLVVGLSFLYTMETWWLGWRLPMSSLLVYAFVGLAVVFAVTRFVGFRQEELEERQTDWSRVAANFAALLLQSFVAAYVILLSFGVLDLEASFAEIVRLGLIQVVPLGFGASIANQLLAQSGEEGRESVFPENLAIFGFGAAFVAFPIAPTEEMTVLAVHAGWPRLAALVVLSVVVVQLVLHELEFRGHGARIQGRPFAYQLGTAVTAYGVGVVVSIVLLAAFGHFSGTTPTESVQLIIVLSFVASVGASAGEVVL